MTGKLGNSHKSAKIEQDVKQVVQQAAETDAMTQHKASGPSKRARKKAKQAAARHSAAQDASSTAAQAEPASTLAQDSPAITEPQHAAEVLDPLAAMRTLSLRPRTAEDRSSKHMRSVVRVKVDARPVKVLCLRLPTDLRSTEVVSPAVPVMLRLPGQATQRICEESKPAETSITVHKVAASPKHSRTGSAVWASVSNTDRASRKEAKTTALERKLSQMILSHESSCSAERTPSICRSSGVVSLQSRSMSPEIHSVRRGDGYVPEQRHTPAGSMHESGLYTPEPMDTRMHAHPFYGPHGAVGGNGMMPAHMHHHHYFSPQVMYPPHPFMASPHPYAYTQGPPMFHAPPPEHTKDFTLQPFQNMPTGYYDSMGMMLPMNASPYAFGGIMHDTDPQAYGYGYGYGYSYGHGYPPPPPPDYTNTAYHDQRAYSTSSPYPKHP